MRAIRISQAIYLLLGASLLVGGAASAFLMYRSLDIGESYKAVLQGEVAQALEARALQITFKKQVQAWKDILLRGKDNAALEKYRTEFYAESAQVDKLSAKLAGEIQDAQAQTALVGFQKQHEALDAQYEAALQGYVASREFEPADQAVKGKDRPPTDSLDAVTERLRSLAASVPQALTLKLHHEQTILSAVLVLLWVVLGTASIAYTRSIAARLRGCIAFLNGIASGDLTRVSPETSNGDELGALVEAMSRMRDELSATVGNIHGIAVNLTAESGRVSSSARDISHSAQEQRSQAKQVAGALEEMLASAREITQHCHDAADEAVEAGRLAECGIRTVVAVASEVRELAKEAQRNAQAVEELGQRSREISRVVTLIQEIAGQTNLLALNAAIESARAGEQGRGFAVVAGEVRRLAERTTSATQEIAEAVESIQAGTRQAVDRIKSSSGRVDKSVATADEAARSLEALGAGTIEVRKRIESIAQASEEQAQASGLVGQSMVQTAASIDMSTSGAEDAARVAEELAALALSLESQTSQFHTESTSHDPTPTRQQWAA